MRKFSKYLRILFLLIVFLLVSFYVFPQPQPPTGNAGQLDPIGGPAPLGSGIFTLCILATSYGIKKFTNNFKKNDSSLSEDNP